jgi:hypothetical protein
MTREKKEKAVGFCPDEFPVLKEFFSGYLHEDFTETPVLKSQRRRARSGQSYAKS